MHKLDRKDNSRQSLVVPKLLKKRPTSLKYWLRNCQRRFNLRLRKLKGKPVILARGFAVGVFAGCFPFFGLQSLIGVFLAILFRGSKITAIAGTWLSNPLTDLPLFVFNFKVGELLLGVDIISRQKIDFELLSHLMESGFTFVATLLTGCTVVGAIASVVSYFVSLLMFQGLKGRKK